MRLLFALLLFPVLAFGADRTLTGDCSGLPAVGSPPTEGSPYDLDGCTINDGDDITGIITGASSRWSTVVLRAPSKTVSVTYTGTTTFTGGQFILLEDQARQNRLTITHVRDTRDARMWELNTPTKVVIGGANLSLTFVGTHPGLGTGKPCTGTRESCTDYTQDGLVYIWLTGNVNPALADIRANFEMTWSAGIHFYGAGETADDSTFNRWQQVNIAGRFLNSSLVINSGVMDLWIDPDRTVFIDPWVRGSGWDGGIAKYHTNGEPVGCFDDTRDMFRNTVGAEVQRLRKVTGGATGEYGFPIFNVFSPKYIGNSATDRYTIRLKDWGHSGPSAITGLPSGVMVKHSTAGGPMKHDPAPTYGATSTTRWLHFIELPSTYGMGQYTSAIASGCNTGNTTDNNFGSGYPFLWRAEASNDGLASPYITAYFDVLFSGVASWQTGGNVGTYAQAATGIQLYTGQSSPDRIHNIVLRAASGTLFPGKAQIIDTSTVTGPGSWYDIVINPVTTTPIATTVNPINNTVTDTLVRGLVTVGSGATGTTISNVDFTGDAAREILNVASGVSITASNWCVRAGSTIGGTGSVVYEGATWTAPYTISGAMSECSITTDGRPNPPGTN